MSSLEATLQVKRWATLIEVIKQYTWSWVTTALLSFEKKGEIICDQALVSLSSDAQRVSGVRSASDHVTCDGAQQPEGGGVPLVLVDHPLASRHRDWDGQTDRLVELASPGLNGHNRGHSHSVTQELGGQLGGDGLGLETEIMKQKKKEKNNHKK